MTTTTAHEVSDQSLIALVSEAPLAWLVSPDLTNSTLLPLLPILDGEKGMVAIEGHMARTNPHVTTLETEKNAAILYQGPDSYMPTTWVANKTLAPTWMFPSVSFRVEVTLLPSHTDTKEHLKKLVAFMEERSGSDWRVEDMGERFDMLASKVIAFRATIQRTEKRFKLGQNEPPEVLREMITGLERANKTDLASWVNRANGHTNW